MIKWNDERWNDGQISAIKASDCSVIVSAAAGSGKTSVLVERLLRIIADSSKNIPVEKMIVVTFTRDAAAEMKQRLSDALGVLIEKNPHDKWLSRQNSMLGCASISTISSFCLDLLKRNISQLAFSSEFRITDDAEHKLFMAQAFKQTSEYYYKNMHDEMKLLRDNFCNTDDHPLEIMIYELYNKISSVPFFDEWLESVEKNYDNGMYEKFISDGLNNYVSQCRAIVEKAVWKSDILDNEKVSELVEYESRCFEKAFSCLEDEDYKGFHDIISSIVFKTFPRAKKTDDLSVRDIIKNCRDSYKDYAGVLAKKSELFVYADEDMEKSREVLSAVCGFIRHFQSELMAIKEQKNAISFDDIEHITLGLLAERDLNGNIIRTPLAKELSEYYEIIMIDEFQDSNNRQDMIFRLLSRNGSAGNYGNNLFFVGDVKQSIYRFRLANPSNFINAMKISKPYTEGTTENSYIKLNRNYRSSKEVIDFSNYVFSCIMSEEMGDIRYDEGEYLNLGAKFCEAERKPVIMTFDGDDKSVENIEAKYVAEKIASMLGKDVVTVFEDGKPKSRVCEMKDFCILIRSNKKIPVYARELEKLGISVSGNSEKGYLSSREISVLMNLLRVTDNPMLDTPLMSVMLSPMFMFTPDEAAQVRLVNKNAGIYTNICKGIGIDDEKPLFEGILLEKARSLHALITELRLYASANTIQELVRTIYDRTDFMSVMQLYGNSERKKANLQMLFEYVGGYEKNSESGLSGFIRYIDRLMESGSDFEMPSVSSGIQNTVSIKSMHKSKGLEFPFVFIVGTDTKFNEIDSRKSFAFSYDMGIGFRLQNPEKHEHYVTLPYEAINNRNRLSDISEEMRLLYVAMTRAKERLFITLNCSEKRVKKACELAQIIYNEEGITPDISSMVKSMSDWIMMCLVSHDKSAWLREKFGIFESYRYDSDFELKYEEFEDIEFSDEISESEVKDESERVASDPALVEKLEKMIGFRYDDTLSDLTAKLSVSDVSKGSSDFDAPLKRPAFMRESGSLTPAEKGTALHTFMQFADFTVLENDFYAELERLYSTGYLTKKQCEVIKKDDIDSFIQSALYKRIRSCKKIHREKKFLIAIDDLELEGEFGDMYRNTSGMLNGIIDMILEFDDYLVLVDYKTDRISDINELAERYSEQIELYRKTLGKTEVKPVRESLIYSFYKKAEIVVD